MKKAYVIIQGEHTLILINLNKPLDTIDIEAVYRESNDASNPIRYIGEV